jgi:hypothetical protein
MSMHKLMVLLGLSASVPTENPRGAIDYRLSSYSTAAQAEEPGGPGGHGPPDFLTVWLWQTQISSFVLSLLKQLLMCRITHT